jgi:hypothetical protein
VLICRIRGFFGLSLSLSLLIKTYLGNIRPVQGTLPVLGHHVPELLEVAAREQLSQSRSLENHAALGGL